MNLDESVTQLTYNYVTTLGPLGGHLEIYCNQLTINLEPANVIAHYVNEQGEALTESSVFQGVVNGPYPTESKTISGYEVLSIIGNTKGYFREEDQQVTYIYGPIKERQTDGKEIIEEKITSNKDEVVHIVLCQKLVGV